MGGRLGKVILAGISLLVALLAAESGLEGLARRELLRKRSAPPAFYPWSLNTSRGERISEWGFLQLAMHPFAVYVNLPGQSTAQYSTDERGFRRNGPDPRPPKAARIVVVGGSAAFGSGLKADGDTLSARLEELLEDTEVINAAVIGHLSGQELSYVVSELVDLEPDLVIALDGWNDLVDQLSGRRRTAHTAGVSNAFFLMEDRLRRLYLLETGGVLRRSRAALPLVFKNVAKLVAGASQTGLAPATGGEAGAGALIGDDPASIARVYAANARKMKIVAEAFGGRFLCVLQPDRESFGRREGRSLGQGYERFRQEAGRRLREAGVAHVDLNDFPEAFERSMFMDRIHLDARGNRAMADVVRGVIQREGLLADRP